MTASNTNNVLGIQQTLSTEITWQFFQYEERLRAQLFSQQVPKVIWLTGLSGSGKSTLARCLQQDLYEQGFYSYILDGDNLRHGLCNNLGFCDEDRLENIRRAAEVAKLLKNFGLIVICAFITPLEQHRDLARSIIGETNGETDFLPIYVKCSLTECERRDPKGLYQKSRNGTVTGFTGIDAAYEPPRSPFIEINTAAEPLTQSRQTLLTSVVNKIKVISNTDHDSSRKAFSKI